MTKILILNGPNLNLLGTRQPEIYGSTTLKDVEENCIAKAKELGVAVECRQTNHEGVLVDWIQGSKGVFDAIIINAGAYTHTSIAIMDAAIGVNVPILELHISNIHEREEFRHVSYIGKAAFDVVMGQGTDGYTIAMDRVIAHLAE